MVQGRLLWCAVGLFAVTAALPVTAEAEPERGVYEVEMVDPEGSGANWLMLWTRRVRPEHDGYVGVSNGRIGTIPGSGFPAGPRQKLPEAKPVEPSVWKLNRRSSDKARRVITSISTWMRGGDKPTLYAFGGFRTTGAAPDTFKMAAFNERIHRGR